MTPHEYANLFPMMPDADLQRMADDIKENGLNDDIITHEGKILDGRNRFKACEIAGVEPRFLPYKGDDPLAFVVSHNLHRRHLNESQRGMVGARLANLGKGNPTGANQHGGGNSAIAPIPTQKQAAEMLNVGVDSIKRSKQVMRSGVPELQDMQMSGEVSATAAAAVSKLPEEEQRKAVSGGVAGVNEAAKKLRQSKSSQTQDSCETFSESSSTQEKDSTSQENLQKRKFKVIESNGMAIYASAKCVMDRLSPKDTEWKESIEAMISYCNKRLQTKK